MGWTVACCCAVGRSRGNLLGFVARVAGRPFRADRVVDGLSRILFSFVASSYSSQRRVFWDSAAWFQAACHGLVSPEGIYYRQFFRTRLIPWPAVFRLEYFPSESGKIEVHLFSRPLPLTFKTSSWSRYTVRELIETPPAAVRVLREHLGEKTFVIRTDKGSK